MRTNPVQEELISPISELSDEQIDLVTPKWLGPDDYVAGDWTSLHGQAADARNEHTAGYLIGEPLLADHLTPVSMPSAFRALITRANIFEPHAEGGRSFSQVLIRVKERGHRREFAGVLAGSSWIGRSESDEAFPNAIGQATDRDRRRRPAGSSAVLRP